MNWIQNSYRRNLIDMHIEDWNEEFFSKLDPKKYVELLKRAHVKSAMVYAQSHVGLCNWPSKFGNMHRGLKNKDFLGETIRLCHEADIDVIVYFSLIYDNWAYNEHPGWRMLNEEGQGTRERNVGGNFGGARYGNVCPNNMEYREYVYTQIKDLCDNYEFEGMYFDMLFWTGICCCDSCKEKYGRPYPAIDWDDPDWNRFQSQREDWMAEFAGSVTDYVNALKPEASVQHQFAPGINNWRYGVTEKLAMVCDYVGGDAYGGISEQSFICKMHKEMSKIQPFDYQSSVCDPNLNMHTIIKTPDYLKMHNYVALAHGGSFMFIDGINPDGTLDTPAYELMGDIFRESEKYEEFAKGELKANVGVYYSFNSKMDKEEKNVDYLEFPHIRSVISACESLRRVHIPYKVITKSSIGKDIDCDVIVLPEAYFVDDAEADFFKAFVSKGGGLYISGECPHEELKRLAGIEKADSMTNERVTYISPNANGEELLGGFKRERPISIRGRQLIAKACENAEILATTTLPYTDPSDGSKFASIHSNPPGIYTDNPAVLRNGRVIWVAAPLEKEEPDVLRDVFANMIKSLMKKPPIFKSQAPAAIEFVVLEQADRMVISIINEQDKLPLVPACDIELFVRTEKMPKKLIRVSDGAEMKFDIMDDYVKIHINKLDMFEMFLLVN